MDSDVQGNKMMLISMLGNQTPAICALWGTGLCEAFYRALWRIMWLLWRFYEDLYASIGEGKKRINALGWKVMWALWWSWDLTEEVTDTKQLQVPKGPQKKNQVTVTSFNREGADRKDAEFELFLINIKYSV